MFNQALPNSKLLSLFEVELHQLRQNADRAFLPLMLGQWVFAILCAVAISPYTWTGSESQVHIHVWSAIFLGGLTISLPCYLIMFHKHSWLTRWTVAAAQALMSALLIHLMAGRIEAHFHIFGMLAFLSFYRDRSVYLPAVTLIAADHLIRGLFWPESVFSVNSPSVTRALEHAAWVIFETTFLCIGISQSLKQLLANCKLQLDLESERDMLDKRVNERTKELNDAQEFLDTIINSLDAQICILDGEGNIIKVNQGWDRFAAENNGPSSDWGNYLAVCREATGDCAPSAQKLAEGIEKVLRNQQESYTSDYACHSDTDNRWFQVSVSPLRLANKSGAVVSHTCITELVLADQKLRKHNEEIAQEQRRLQSIVDCIPHSIFWKNKDFSYGGCNQAFARLAGLEDSKQIVGLMDKDLPWPEESSAYYEMLDHEVIFGARATISIEETLLSESGESLELLRTKARLVDEDANVVGMVGVVADVSEMKHAERERDRFLNESTELAKIIRESPDEVYIFDQASLKFLEVNKGACQATGYSKSELLDLTPIDLKPSFDEASFRKTIEPLYKGEISHYEFQTDHRKKNGEDYPAGISLHTSEYQTRPVFVAFVRDLTEIKSLEQQLASSQKLESLGQLSAGIAHEINTPMQFVGDNIEYLSESSELLFQVVDAYQEMLNDDAPLSWDKRRTEIERINKECHFDHIRMQLPEAIVDCRNGIHRTVKIVKAMKSFSHPGEQDKSSIDINETIESAIEVSRNRWKYAAEISLELDSNLPLVPAFASEMNQVLLNLVVNASDAVTERFEGNTLGLITIRTKQLHDSIQIEVEDNGCGIPESIIHKVFDPFFTTKEVGKGTGQGLSITHNVIVNMHGGKIEVDSELNEGTLFKINLPLHQQQTENQEDSLNLTSSIH